MLNRSSQHDDRRDRHESSTSARQAAEALFAPKAQRVEPVIREAAPSGEAVRKPRVLAVGAAVSIPHDEPAQQTHAQPLRERVIPTADIARIRAWLKYGMTPAQVATMYGVATGEVEQLLRTS